MLQIDLKSPDRVNVLLALDGLNAATVHEQSDGFAGYAIWCAGVDEQVLRARLGKVCRHEFSVRDGDPPNVQSAGGHFGAL